jgi:hypothetical protein
MSTVRGLVERLGDATGQEKGVAIRRRQRRIVLPAAAQLTVEGTIQRYTQVLIRGR